MSSGKKSSDLVSREGRQQCWNARDAYWKCLDDAHEDKAKCLQERKLFETECSNTWVKHFDRRREYLKFKKVVDSGQKDLIDEMIKKGKPSGA